MKTIGTYRTLALTKTVVFAKPSELPGELDDNDEGCHIAQKGLVVVNEEYASEPTRIRDVICHEAMHDWLDASGARKLLQDNTHLSGDEYERFEEQLVLKMGPALSSSIASLYMLVGVPDCPGYPIASALELLRKEKESET